MFFILSKTLQYLLMPTVWLLALLIYAAASPKQLRRKRALLGALALFIVSTNNFLANSAFRAWEVKPVDIASLPPAQTAVVLTGVTMEGPGNTDRVFFSKGADRVSHTVQLYKLGKINRVIISGGSGALIGKRTPEATLLKRVFLDSGLPDSVLYLDTLSKNTRENALYSKRLADSLHLKGDFLLVTSAFHMKRAKACFDKVGFQTTIFPVDYHTELPARNNFDDYVIPSAGALQKWTLLIHEISGYVIYRLSGYA